MSGTIELVAEPQSVGQAREWVVTELGAMGRDDLADAAELGVSELVTNAILHATPPISVRVGGTVAHPRIEVHDNSVAPPTMRDMTDDERLLATVGRGLGIVAMFSSTWGAEVTIHGKVVWFEPASEPVVENVGHVHGGDVFDLSLVVQRRLEEDAPAADRYDVHLLGMPVQVFARHRAWYDEVRRELRLLALNHGEDYPVAKELSEITLQVEQERSQATGIDVLDKAMAAGDDRVDLTYRVPTTAAVTMDRLQELLGQVDEFCQEQRLLTLAPSRQMLALRAWYLGEFRRQADGEEPRPWSGGYQVDESV
jgi:anti-sigma regulatory factor (Ser/Thr protein kinase)